MDVTLTIGDFSKMTHLSVKALRHYHEVGLLEPAQVDPVTGYRHYSTAQVGTAQAIRRFRDLDMPIDEVRDVLRAPDIATRNRVILGHLERIHRQLEKAQATVASLHALLAGDPVVSEPGRVEIRRLPATHVVTARATVDFDGCGAWLDDALAGLHAALDRAQVPPAGPDGALYPDEFFTAGLGEVTGFVPIGRPDAGGTPPAGVDGPAVADLAATTVAVLRHEGAFADLDRAYGALGAAVADRGIGGPGPIREHYLSATSIDVCWPVAPSAVDA